MHIGMPACGQRQFHFIGQARAQHADFAGAGDMNQVRLEAVENFADQRNVAQKGGVEAKILFQGKGHKAARQLQRPYVSVFFEGIGAVAGTHAQEGQIVPPGERLKMAAGMRHSVDFVERVGEVGHTRHACTRRFAEHRIEGFGQHLALDAVSA